MRPLAESVVLVTGAARGIGRNIASAFARRGSQVFLCDRDRIGLDRVVESIRASNGKAHGICIDLSEAGAPQRMVREAESAAGRLDALVNNAQSTVRTAFLDETEETWDRGIVVTLKAAFFAAQEAARVMGKRDGGSIVSIASIASMLATHESPSYHAAKAGLVQITRYLATEAGHLGVRVNCISPAFIVQDEHRARYDAPDNGPYRALANHVHPLGEPGNSDDVANAVLFLCSPEAYFVNGQNVVLDGGMSLQDQFCLLRDFKVTTSGK